MPSIGQISRTLHTSQIRMTKYKSLLQTLRKNTGNNIEKCRLALEICHNDIVKAEEWLNELAEQYKLVDKSKLGLVAVSTDKNAAAMVEVNCEASYTVENHLFRNLAANVANTCLSKAKEENNFENSIARVLLNTDELNSLKGWKGKTLGDKAANATSFLRENITLKRALCLNVKDNLRICGCTHPLFSRFGSGTLGFAGSLLVYKTNAENKFISNVVKQLCLHVIGMAPSKIGDPQKDKPLRNKYEESCMIHQQFLLEEDILVSDVLRGTGISLVEFTRFQCGEKQEEVVDDDQSEENTSSGIDSLEILFGIKKNN